MIKVIGIVGWKDVGKTFFATEIIKSLVKKNFLKVIEENNLFFVKRL